jgi:hypothetical protein
VLLRAFTDPSLSDKRDEIRACRSPEEILHFFQRQQLRSLYFIIDQKNALESEKTNMDDSTNGDKDDAWKFLRTLTAKHYAITSASENYSNADGKEAHGCKEDPTDGWDVKGGQIFKTLFHLLFLPSPREIGRDGTVVEQFQGKIAHFRRR